MQKKSALEQVGSPDLSAIDRASFMEGLQLNHDNPLHSTALEEDLIAFENGQLKGKTSDSARGTLKTSKGGAVKRSCKEEAEGGDVREKQRTVSGSHHVVSSKGRRSMGQQAAARRTRQSQQQRENKKTSNKESDKLNSDSSQQRRRSTLSSSDESADDSWKPSPKKPRRTGFVKSSKPSQRRPSQKKTSSGVRRHSSPQSTENEADEAASRGESLEKGRRGRVTEMELVLDAFLNTCDQYKESVESPAVKKSISCFCSNVKEQLLEKVISNKEQEDLIRENTKMGLLISKKTRRLLDAKHELMTAKRQLSLLEKQKTELQQKIKDLRKSQAFLRDMGGITGAYLEHRRTHPTEEEKYGASSLAALLLEAKVVQEAKHQQEAAVVQQKKTQLQ